MYHHNFKGGVMNEIEYLEDKVDVFIQNKVKTRRKREKSRNMVCISNGNNMVNNTHRKTKHNRSRL